MNKNEMQDAVDQINRLIPKVRKYKAAFPETKFGFQEKSAGSLLNAYREGDLSFAECTERLIPRATVADALDGLRAEIHDALQSTTKRDDWLIILARIGERLDAMPAKLGLQAAESEGR